MEILLIILAIVVVLALLIGLWGMGAYNGFVRSRNSIQESWRQIDVELNRRYDLIPNLIETVRGFAAHERNTLEQVTQLRNMAQSLAGQSGGQPNQQRAAIESQLTQAVHNLIVSVEAYPELKSNVNFMELQNELTSTEDRIAAARRFYNANVRDYNTRIESVPTNLIANFAKFEKATYFEVTDPTVRQAPEVNFGEISQRPAAAPQQPAAIEYQQAPAPVQPPANPYQQGAAAPYQQPAQLPQQPVQQPQQPGGYTPPFTN